VRRRLFKCLEKSVPRFFGEHVRLVDYVKFVWRFKRHRIDAFAQFANVVDAAIRCSVHFVEIFIAYAKRVRENTRNRSLPRPAPAGKKVRMRDFFVFD
jgi:hypothetical protein